MDSRGPWLKKIFDDVVSGDRELNGSLIPHFIRSISTHPDPATCLYTLVTSNRGLKAVQTAASSDLSTGSLNGDVASLLACLRDSKLEYLGGGDTLQRLLRALVEVQDFWSSLVAAFRAGKLRRSAELSFSWLFFQLVVSPPEISKEYRRAASDTDVVPTLLRSSDPETRRNARKISHIVSLYPDDEVVPPDWLEVPGWRHDNDPCSYREISVLPTPDEINSTERPSLKTIDEIDDLKFNSPIKMFKAHVENQFRLLREDLVHDTRENVQVALRNKKGKRTGEFITGLLLTGIYTEDKSKWGLMFAFSGALPLVMSAMDVKSRKAFLEQNPSYLRRGAFACLVSGNEIVAFVTIIRDEWLLAQDHPTIVVQLEGRAATKDTLVRLRKSRPVSLAQLSTPLFAYGPVLRSLQTMRPTQFFLDGTLFVKPHRPRAAPGDLSDTDQGFVSSWLSKLRTATGSRKPVSLDDAQTKAFICGLTQKVALIQGPPGTGKSFIGALLVNALRELTSHRIVVCCYTNHALDQFLEDLLKQGIPKSYMVRLGSKPSPSTADMTLRAQTAYRFGGLDWEEISDMSRSLNRRADLLQHAFSQFIGPPSPSELLDHLKLSCPAYFKALSVPPTADDMIPVGKTGRAIEHTYLLGRWLSGGDAGVFRNHPMVIGSRDVWSLSLKERKTLEARWRDEILDTQMEAVIDAGIQYNACQAPIIDKFQQRTRQILRCKRIIACTTTGAAIFRDAIQSAQPEILVVEEAGEVLESHILTALGHHTERLILIGDHKQLRPKVNSYELTVEKGDGYDLNRSLFERLVTEGHPYRTLSKQHRMRPEISSLVRHLAYPDLTDAPGTESRPPIRGLQNTVIFIDHNHPEDEDSSISDPEYLDATTSKSNRFEVEMIAKIVGYLKQQEYKPSEITVLTPYLEQLTLLRRALRTDDEILLDETDEEELGEVGLDDLDDLLRKLLLEEKRKKSLKIATIDNYQGEENDIIVASLTRSNEAGNVGFMSSPERLNVLLSRARNGLIIVGNSETFLKSRNGKEIWSKFFDMMKRQGYFYKGLPVRCERHNHVENVLRLPGDFERLCPGGGCSAPCGVTMNCGIHTCPRKCHEPYDHKVLPCPAGVQTFPCGHRINRGCHLPRTLSATCSACKPAKRNPTKVFNAYRSPHKSAGTYEENFPKLPSDSPHSSRGGLNKGPWGSTRSKK